MNPVEIAGALCYRSGFEVDADGAPNAYGPPGTQGLDYLANAGKPGNWFGVVVAGGGIPVVQGDNDPCPGYYISTTALCDSSRAIADPRRYVDSTTIPYVSVARNLRGMGVRLGDVCWVVRGDKHCEAIVADIGPSGKYGEGSIALAKALEIPASPKNGGCSGGVAWVIFKGSSKGWPRDWQDVQAQAREMFMQWGADNLQRF